MAEKPIKFEFVAEVAQYLRDTKKLAVSTEDIADALLHVTNESGDLEKKLARAMREAEKDVVSLERALKDLPKATGNVVKDMARDFDKIGDEAKEAGREAGDEFRQNLGESLASGDLGDIFADTLGGLISSLKGPIGLGVAAVGSAALLVFNKMKEDYQATITSMTGMAQALVDKQIEVGRQFLFQQEKLEVAKGLLSENPGLWEKIRQAAEPLGMTLEDVMGAMLGTKEEGEAFRLKLGEIVDAGSEVDASLRGATLSPQAQQASELLGYLRKAEGATGEANTQFLNMQSLLGVSAANAERIQDALRNARDYGAGLGGRAPIVGAGDWQFV